MLVRIMFTLDEYQLEYETKDIKFMHRFLPRVWMYFFLFSKEIKKIENRHFMYTLYKQKFQSIRLDKYTIKIRPYTITSS